MSTPLDVILSLYYNSIMDTEKTATTHITMRFPADLIEVLRTFAKEDARSLHSEVLWILRDYITRRQQKQG